MNIPPRHDPSCWGCGDNPTGIHPSPEREVHGHAGGSRSASSTRPGRFVHGGLVAAALDEAAGLLRDLVPLSLGDHEAGCPLRGRRTSTAS